MKKIIEWHHLLGMTLLDYFTNTKYNVEMEKELEMTQFLDILLIEENWGKTVDELPDGLEDLRKYNLLSYKSKHEPLDSWVIDELTGYYVLFRKIMSEDEKLIPVEDFKLIGVSTRFPRKLSKEENDFKKIKDGVYQIKRGEHFITIIVLSIIPKEKRNAIWNLFSNNEDHIAYGLEHYGWKRNDLRDFVTRKHEQKLSEEGIIMPYTVEQFKKDVISDLLSELTIEDVLKNYRPEDVFKNYRPEERLRGLKAKDVLKNYRPEERLRGLKIEEIKEYLNNIKS